MNLDLVLGMSCKNISCLACDQTSALAAHTASGVLVLLDTTTNCQVRYIHLRQNALSSVKFSADGKLIVTGEIGYRPAVRVWRVKDGQEVAALYGHEFGIKSTLFCSNMTQIVSVGLEHDNVVNLWAWPEKHRIATNKIVDVIKAVACSENGSFFVTAGIRHIKFWYPDLSWPSASSTIIPPVQCLYGRPGILGDCKQQTFIDVACGNGSSAHYVYCITRNGGLVIVNASDRLVHSHKSIEDCKGNCLKVQDQILFMGFNSGDIHLFNALSLIHLASLPAPTFFRRACMNGGGVFTLVFNPCTTLLITAYKNSSMCVWDLKDVSNVKQKYVAVYHSKAITNSDIFTTSDARGHIRETLVTVSHDSTVRLWGVVIGDSICYDRLSILYTDDTPPQPLMESQNKALDNAGIITAVKVSPDQKLIVTGNRVGNICVYDRVTFEHSLTVLAHNREITCLAIHTDSAGQTVLASGSRDRLIHIMDVNHDFRLIATFNIHSSSITVVSICEMSGTVNMISCSADRSLSVCTSPVIYAPDSTRSPVFQLNKFATIMSTPTDICIDLFTKQVSVGCQDGYIRILDMEMLQERRMFRGCTCEERQIHKLCLDKKGVLLLSAASDKTINVIRFATGDILVTLAGHTKFVTGLVFTSSGDHVISTAMDGCVFIWHISEKALQKQVQKSKKQVHVVDSFIEMTQKTNQRVMSSPVLCNLMEKTYAANCGENPEKVGDTMQNLKHKVYQKFDEKNRSCCQLSDVQNIQTNIKPLMTTASNVSVNSATSAPRNPLRSPRTAGMLAQAPTVKTTSQNLKSQQSRTQMTPADWKQIPEERQNNGTHKRYSDYKLCTRTRNSSVFKSLNHCPELLVSDSKLAGIQTPKYEKTDNYEEDPQLSCSSIRSASKVYSSVYACEDKPETPNLTKSVGDYTSFQNIKQKTHVIRAVGQWN